MTVPGMKKIFSAVAMTAAVITLTLASADVLASGKGNNGKGNSKETSSQTTSSSKGNSASHQKQDDKKTKGSKEPGASAVGGTVVSDDACEIDENFQPLRHAISFVKYELANGTTIKIEGYGGEIKDPRHPQRYIDFIEETYGSAVVSYMIKAGPNYYDGTGALLYSGVRSNLHSANVTLQQGSIDPSQVSDPTDDCDDDDNGGGGDNGGGIVLPEGCFMAAAYSDNSFASLFNTTKFGYVINASTNGTEIQASAVTPAGIVLGTFGFGLDAASDYTLLVVTTATGYEARTINFYQGALGSYTPDTAFTHQWTGNAFTYEKEFIGPLGEITEIVAEAIICEVGSDPVPN